MNTTVKPQPSLEIINTVLIAIIAIAIVGGGVYWFWQDSQYKQQQLQLQQQSATQQYHPPVNATIYPTPETQSLHSAYCGPDLGFGVTCVGN